MAIDETLVLKGQGSVDVQVGGPGNPWQYLSACAGMDGPSIPLGDTEVRWCQDTQRAGKFIISNKFRTAPDQITGNLTTKLGKTDYLSNLDCPFSMRARYSDCGVREDLRNFSPIMWTFCDIDLTEISPDDLVITDPGNEDEIIVTAAWSASNQYRVEKVVGSRAGSLTDFGDQAINDIEICSVADCGGSCGARKDDCSTFHMVTDKDSAPYAWPNHIQGNKSVVADTITWSVRPVIGIDGNLEGVECAADRIFVSSNGASIVAYNEDYDDDGFLDQDTWNLVVLTYAPAANGNALFARTSKEIWCGCESGYVAKSVDSGDTYTYTNIGTAETVNAVYAYDADLVYAVCNAGIMFRSTDGGGTWADISDVATTNANLLNVLVPPGREREVYISTNDGMMYRSEDYGATWAEMAIAGDGVGTIPDFAFCGPCNGDVLWIVHNDAGPRGRVLRDLSGGNGSADVFVEADYTDVISGGVQLNAIACCGVNEAWAAGEVSGGYPAVIKLA